MAEINRKSAATQTVGATTATMLDYVVPEDSVVGIDIGIVGKNTSNSDGVYIRIGAMFKRDGSSTPSKEGTNVELVPKKSSTSMSGVSADAVISGNTIQVQVTGDTGLTVAWIADIQYWVN